MQVLIKRSKLFHHIGTVGVMMKDPAGNEVAAENQERFHIGGSDQVVNIPDWCKDTLTFKVGVADGSIIDLSPVVRTLPEEVGGGAVKVPSANETDDDDGDDSKSKAGKSGGKSAKGTDTNLK